MGCGTSSAIPALEPPTGPCALQTKAASRFGDDEFLVSDGGKCLYIKFKNDEENKKWKLFLQKATDKSDLLMAESEVVQFVYRLTDHGFANDDWGGYAGDMDTTYEGPSVQAKIMHYWQMKCVIIVKESEDSPNLAKVTVQVKGITGATGTNEESGGSTYDTKLTGLKYSVTVNGAEVSPVTTSGVMNAWSCKERKQYDVKTPIFTMSWTAARDSTGFGNPVKARSLSTTPGVTDPVLAAFLPATILKIASPLALKNLAQSRVKGPEVQSSYVAESGFGED